MSPLRAAALLLVAALSTGCFSDKGDDDDDDDDDEVVDGGGDTDAGGFRICSWDGGLGIFSTPELSFGGAWTRTGGSTRPA